MHQHGNDVSERLGALSSAMLDSTSFLLLRNSLRHQFLRSPEVSALISQAGEGPSATTLSVFRSGSAAGAHANTSQNDASSASVSVPAAFVEGVEQSAIDFAVKAFASAHSSKSMVFVPQQQNAEQRQLLAGRMHRDAMLWSARGFDAQLRLGRQRRSRPPSPPAAGAVSPSTSQSNASGSTEHATTSAYDALNFIVNAAQREWRALINVRVESLKILTQNPSLRLSQRNESRSEHSDAGEGQSASSPRSSSGGAAPALSSDDLFAICVERANTNVVGAIKRRAAHAASVQSAQCPQNVDGKSTSGGSKPAEPVQVENLGYFSCFHSSIHVIFQEAGLLPTISDIREALGDMDPAIGPARPEYCHQGNPTAGPSEDLFLHLIECGDRPDILCQTVLRRGVPPSVRRLVYAKLLHLPLSLSTSNVAVASNVCHTRKGIRFATANAAKALAESAQQGRALSSDSALQSRQLIRQMVASDIASRLGDSDKTFLFQDECTSVASALLEDRTIAEYHLRRHVEQQGGDVGAYISAHTTPSGVRVPACGIMPFSTSSSVIAPLSYVTGDLCEHYELAAAMQGQLWAPVQSATPELFAMLILFDRLVAHYAPAAVFHCHTKLSFSPVSVAFKWMVNGFAELFEPAQILEVWDLLLAVNAQCFFGIKSAKPYWVMSVVAASVFVFRAPLVQQCFTSCQVSRLFDDCVKLCPILLLQQMLFLL